MSSHVTSPGTVYELDLNDIEILDECWIQAARWRDVLDTLEDPRAGVTEDRWASAMERADTRIWIRPYAARLD